MWPLLVAALVVCIAHWRQTGKPFGDYVGQQLLRMYVHLWHRWSVRRLAEIPDGGALLYANHTASPDGAFVSNSCYPKLPGILTAGEYFGYPLFGRLMTYMGCVPVMRDRADVRAARMALRRLQAGKLLCIFPEGDLANAGRSKPRIVKLGVAFLALRSRVPVIPVQIRGGPQSSHVVNGWLLPSPRSVHVTVGCPVDLSGYYGRPITRKILYDVTVMLMDRLVELDAVSKYAR